MENASKALIIAGAILLSILIIGLGMMIFNQAKDAMGNTGMDAQKINAYNSKFTQYEGRQPGATAKQVVNAVISHNLTTAQDESEFINVTLGQDSAAETNTATEYDPTTFNSNIRTNVLSKIKAGKTYDVSYGVNPKSGLVVCINLKEQT